MGDYREQFAAQGLRGINVRVARGDVRVERIDGDMVVIASDDPVQIEHRGDVLEVRAHEGPRMDRGKKKNPHVVFSHEAGNLGNYISEVVSNAVDSVFSGDFLSGTLFGADIVVRIPAVLERPAVEISTGHGDLDVEGIVANYTLKSNSGDVTIKQAGGALQVTTGMGDLSIDGFDGPIMARTGSGSVNLSNCPSGGSVHTGSGDIEGEEVRGTWEIQSGAGDIEIDVDEEASLAIVTGAGDVSVAGGALSVLQVQTGSGDVQSESLLLGPRHRVTTGHGDIVVALADPPGARLQIITRSGSVNSEFPLVTVGKQGPHSHGGARYVGNIGDSTIDVELRTASGDIAITRLNPDRAAAARTAAAQAAADTARDATDRDQAFRDVQRAQAERAERAFGFPAPPTPPTPPVPPVPPIAPIPPTPPTAPSLTWSQGDEGKESDSQSPATPEEPAAQPVAASSAPSSSNTRLEVLESLRRGQISIEEATRLLDALG